MGRDTRAIAKAGVRPTAGVYRGPKRAVTALLLVSVTVHRRFPGARAVPVEEPRAAIGLGGERDGGVGVEAALPVGLQKPLLRLLARVGRARGYATS